MKIKLGEIMTICLAVFLATHASAQSWELSLNAAPARVLPGDSTAGALDPGASVQAVGSVSWNGGQLEASIESNYDPSCDVLWFLESTDVIFASEGSLTFVSFSGVRIGVREFVRSAITDQ